MRRTEFKPGREKRSATENTSSSHGDGKSRAYPYRDNNRESQECERRGDETVMIIKRLSIVFFGFAPWTAAMCAAAAPINVGSRLELFVDDGLIERLSGAERRLHHPVPANVALVCDRPWEGNWC